MDNPVITGSPVDETLAAPKRRGPGRPSGRPTGSPTITDRTQLLEAAERIIKAEGPRVSLEEIAAAAGVTKPILYQHVGKKDALVEALAARHDARIRSAVDRAVAEASDRRTALRAFVAAFFSVIDDHQNLYLYLTSGSWGEGWLTRSLALTDQSAEPLAAALRDERISAGADPSVATSWAYGIIGMLHHTALWWIRETGVSVDVVSDQMTELLWAGLRGETT